MSSGAEFHDGPKALADLRDHLARHDKPIAFLFGAGTSCAIRVPDPSDGTKSVPFIPAVAQLTAECKAEVEKLGGAFLTAWPLIEANCRARGLAANIEDVLSCVRMMLRAIGDGDMLAGLSRSELSDLERSIRRTIVRLVTPDVSRLPGDYPHRALARWIGLTSRMLPIEIFTLNYDVLLEHALETERVSLFDGFVGGFNPYFFAQSLRHSDSAPAPSWTRLWKVHGSVTWKRQIYLGRSRVIRGGIDAEGEMILPSFEKYDESRQQPYAAFTDRLARFLELDDAMVVTAGFSFGDEHINELIFSALDNKPRTHVYALQFDEPKEDSDLLKRSLSRPNMIVVGPRSGTFRGQRAAWRPEEPPAHLSRYFGVGREVVAGGGTPAEKAVGEMKIGDFGVFCRFLESMTPA